MSVVMTPSELRDDVTLVAQGTPSPTPTGIVGEAIDTVRFLAIDAVERAKSGHAGTPMALVPPAYALFTRHLRQDPVLNGIAAHGGFGVFGGHLFSRSAITCARPFGWPRSCDYRSCSFHS